MRRVSLKTVLSAVAIVLLLVAWLPVFISGNLAPRSPQVILSVLSVGLIVVAILPRKSFWLIAGIAVLGIIAMELLLRQLPVSPSRYTPEMFSSGRERVSFENPLYVCDAERACRLNPAYDGERYCDQPENPLHRWCYINAQGYAATFDYVPENIPEGAYRVLVLGDSFTFGLTSKPGHSWVEVLADLLNERQLTAVWNTGIGGTGTLQALASARELLPVMRPHIVILGFYGGNDFYDNLLPADKVLAARVGSSPLPVLIVPYYLDNELNPQRFSEENIYLIAQGMPPIMNEAQRWLRQSALYRLFEVQFASWFQSVNNPLGLLPSVFEVYRPSESAKAIALTTNYLRQLKEVVEEWGSQVIVMNIPSPMSYLNVLHGQSHLQQLREIAQTLDIPVIEVFDQMTLSDYGYITKSTDNHWNDSGHAIAGRIVSEYVQALIDQGALGSP